MMIRKSFGVKREYIDTLIFLSVSINWKDSKTKRLLFCL